VLLHSEIPAPDRSVPANKEQIFHRFIS